MLKVMPWPWVSLSKQVWVRSLKWGTVRSCRSRGCKNIRGQSWRSKKNLPDHAGCGCISLKSGWVSNFLSTSNFDLWYFRSLLTYKNVQYLILKIWLIPVWRLKARIMVQLLMWFMFAQSALFSYHTEAFVKTKVGCTVVVDRNSLA